MMIAIAGGSGFVGKSLTEYFLSQNHKIIILTRNASKQSKDVKYVKWLTETSTPEKELEGVEAIINLAGQSINTRWSPKQKKEIMESRIKSASAITDIIKKLASKPKVVIHASAVGIYGTSLNETFTEESKTVGDDFLAQTVKAWEKAASQIQNLGVQTVFARFGVILGKSGGALPKMLLPYKLFMGGRIGSGMQWVSWIHLQDVVQALAFILAHSEVSGPVNITAPNPVTMNQFGQNLAVALNRPHWLITPSFALKALLGEMSILVLKGQKVLPQKLENNGYPFLFPNLHDALTDILN